MKCLLLLTGYYTDCLVISISVQIPHIVYRNNAMSKGTEDNSSHVVKCHQIQYSCTKKHVYFVL